MDYGQQLRQANEHALQNFYQPTGNRFERVERKSLIIDNEIEQQTSFSVSLEEPLKIDKHCDVFLDTFTTYFCNTSHEEPDNTAFLFNINELNIHTDSNESNSFHKIFIPNSQSADDGTLSNIKVAVTHKNKKFNYICSINPTTLSQISGTLTNLAGGPIMHATDGTHKGRFIAELVFVSRGD
jgi:hypothetical protein